MVETFPHTLDAQGRWVLPLAIPIDPSYGDVHFYFQAGYLDPGSATGFAATSALDMWVR
jgi:hypothetical protein